MGIFGFLFKKQISTSATVPENKNKVIKPATDLGFTDSELEVLSRLITYDPREKPQGIINAYHENIPRLAKTFISVGLLQLETDEDRLSQLKVVDLKALLKNHDIKTNGKKSELIQRILSEIPRGQLPCPRERIYHISQTGEELLREYKIRRTKEQSAFEFKCINLIANRQINEAYQEICKSKSSGIAAGLNMNWEDELEYGLKKSEEKGLVAQLDFSDPETDGILLSERILFNASCTYCYLSGSSKSLKTFENISDNKYSGDIRNSLSLRASTYMSILSAERDLRSYKEDGVERYQNICGYDSVTCDKCGAMDMKIFNVGNAKIGINCPPFHKGCRCTTVPYFDDTLMGTKIARDRENKNIYIPGTMNLTEYRKKYLN